MNKIKAVLLFVLPFMKLASQFARNIDPDDAGIDDEIATKIDEIVVWLEAIIGKDTANSLTGYTVARGYSAIAIFGNNIIASLKLIYGDTVTPYAERLAQAQELASYLSDSSKVYQAKRGDDAELLKAFKLEADNLVTQINLQKGSATDGQ